MIILSYKRPQNIAPLVGMLLRAPSIGNVIGAVTECPTGAEQGIAVWREEGFFAGRLSLFQRLLTL